MGEEYQRRRIGRGLLEAIVKKGEEVGLHTIITRITEDNSESSYLHRSAGFEDIGVMREVGRKFGKVRDVHLMQMIYPVKIDSSGTVYRLGVFNRLLV